MTVFICQSFFIVGFLQIKIIDCIYIIDVYKICCD
nr:MAG TPA: hypothetical protein [Caudoviricetes sp.]DAY16627.1 MAG TPA: hypothetical protein [Caudoviricetes sp.]